MFYVVYLEVPRRNIIIPCKWILNYERQMEKDMFFGVNPSQRILVFYSPNAYDADGRPYEDFQPNFRLDVDTNFPNEGCFIAKPKTFKGKFIS